MSQVAVRTLEQIGGPLWPEVCEPIPTTRHRLESLEVSIRRKGTEFRCAFRWASVTMTCSARGCWKTLLRRHGYAMTGWCNSTADEGKSGRPTGFAGGWDKHSISCLAAPCPQCSSSSPK
jgi:hypothetical protein